MQLQKQLYTGCRRVEKHLKDSILKCPTTGHTDHGYQIAFSLSGDQTMNYKNEICTHKPQD